MGGDIAYNGDIYRGSLYPRKAGSTPWEEKFVGDDVLIYPFATSESNAVRVGVGTTAPEHELDVGDGTIRARDFIGNLDFSNVRGVPISSSNAFGITKVVDPSDSNDGGATYSDVGEALRSTAFRYLSSNVSNKVSKTGDTMSGDLNLVNGADLIVKAPGKLGVNITSGNPQSEVDVAGDVNISGHILKNGSIHPDILVYSKSPWEEANGKVFLKGGSNVGIGTSDPQSSFETTGDLKVGGSLFQNGKIRHFPWSGNGIDEDVVFKGPKNVGVGVLNPTYKLQVDGSIFCQDIVTSSDPRKKTDIDVIPPANALDGICKLNGYTYKWKDPDSEASTISNNKVEAGVLADEVLDVFPGIVCGYSEPIHNDIEVQDERRQVLQGIKYANFTAYIVQAIKQLRAEINEIKSKNDGIFW